MHIKFMTRMASLFLGITWLVTEPAAAVPQDSFKVIEGPGGGQVVFGPAMQGTPPAAMAGQ